jgi:prepilin-type N-terminal cleavage/methylation domain-containing protein
MLATTSPKSRFGFTLIELVVVIAIIGILSITGAVAFSNSLKLARDGRRKQDLDAITQALRMYYQEYGRYPRAGACAYGTGCYVYSTSGGDWIPALAPYFSGKAPVDPTNNRPNPWTAGNYSYAYGFLTSDGQAYNLIAQLENPNDPDRCGLKDYHTTDLLHLCTAFGGSYSNNDYVVYP